MLIHPEWCEKILHGRKRWEIRGTSCKKRERVCIAAAGTGTLVGEATVVDCLQVGAKNDRGEWTCWGSPENFLWLQENHSKHQIYDRNLVQQYSKLYAWVLDHMWSHTTLHDHTPTLQVVERGCA